MQFRFVLRTVASSLVTFGLAACAATPVPPVSSVEGFGARSQGLILQAHEGERRVRRSAGGAPFILKAGLRGLARVNPQSALERRFTFHAA